MRHWLQAPEVYAIPHPTPVVQVSYFFENRFDMVHIQNATLAGGVGPLASFSSYVFLLASGFAAQACLPLSVQDFGHKSVFTL